MLKLRSLLVLVAMAVLLNACGVGIDLQPATQASSAADNATGADPSSAASGLSEADIEATVQARLQAERAASPNASAAPSAADPATTPTIEAAATSATERVPNSATTSATERVPTAEAASVPCPSTPAATTNGDGASVPAATEQAEAAPPAMLLILDASGSMLIDDGNGKRKIDAAKDALNQLVDALPDGAPVGLRVYGHRFPNTDKANGCQDTELIAPIAPLNKNDMKAKIGSFEAKGFTPISTSLEQAANDLPPEGERTIVLVSDGEETCDRDPCQVARDLVAKGINVKVETVGFQVDAATRSQLECIAEATGGSYRDAANAAELADQLKQISTRALKTYQRVGNAVAGGDSFNNAADVQPGQYTDSIKVNETLYYAVDLQEGQQVRFSATFLGQSDITFGDSAGSIIQLEFYDPNRKRLTLQSGDSFGGNTATGVLETDPVPQTGVYYVTLKADQYTNSMQGREFQTELVVNIPSVNGDPCAPADPNTSVTNATPVPPGSVQGGSDFNVPAVLQAGQYTDSIKVNETLFYAVNLEEGQRLTMSATFEGQPDLSFGDSAGSIIQLEFYDPNRKRLTLQSGDSFGGNTATGVLETDPVPQTGVYYVTLKADQYTNSMQGREFRIELVVGIQ